MATTTPAVQNKTIQARGENLGDRIFAGLTSITAFVIVAIVVLFTVVFVSGAWQAITHNGTDFFTSFNWPNSEDDNYGTVPFGALNYIYGTLITSAIALLIGGLASMGAAIFLSEYAPTWLRSPLSFVVELLAAVPSIVYGFWGIQFLSPIMGNVEQSLSTTFGWLPLFGNAATGTVNGHPISLKVGFTGRDILVASLVLSVMIIPTITSISRDVLRTVPDNQREGMLAMGATKWQTIRRAVLPFGQRGIIGAIILGLGRALGETIAVAFLIGGAKSSLGPQTTVLYTGETIASKFANNYNEISPADKLGFSSFLELGLVLFIITLIINAIAQWLVSRGTKVSAGGPKTAGGLVLSWLGRLFFPLVVLVASPYISIWVSLVLIVIWGIFQAISFMQTRAEEQGRSLPRPVQLIADPEKSYGYRKFSNRFMQGLFILSLLVAIVPLVAILALVTINGLPQVFKPDFLINDTSGRPVLGGPPTANAGIGQAILGTGILVGLASLIGIPIGILAGVYLSEYGNNRFGNLVRFTADVLVGIPSIIMGLFVLSVAINNSWFVPGQKYNGWAGAVALAIMAIPIISRTTEEILRLVPNTLREAALALGIPKWRSTLTVIIPAAASGVVTGVILAVARIAGETAPILLTARGNDSFNGLGDQTPALTLVMYTYGRRPDAASVDRSWGAAFVLMVLIMLLSFGVRFITRSRVRATL